MKIRLMKLVFWKTSSLQSVFFWVIAIDGFQIFMKTATNVKQKGSCLFYCITNIIHWRPCIHILLRLSLRKPLKISNFNFWIPVAINIYEKLFISCSFLLSKFLKYFLKLFEVFNFFRSQSGSVVDTYYINVLRHFWADQIGLIS